MKPHIVRHKSYKIKRRKRASPVLMFKSGIINPEYKSKLVSRVWNKKEENSDG